MNQKTVKIIRRYAKVLKMTMVQYRGLKKRWHTMNGKERFTWRKFLKTSASRLG